MSKSPAIKTNYQTSGYNVVVCVRISPDDYCRMAVSTRKLVRCDDKAAELRGLQDLETGERFFIDEHDLFRRDAAGRQLAANLTLPRKLIAPDGPEKEQ
jgi:hypothetical protein